MKRIFIAFIILITLFSCENKSTPTIYPSKIGVDPAYADLVKKDKPIESIDLSEKKLKNKKVVKVSKTNTVKPVENIDKIIALSVDNTTDVLIVSYGKASKEITKNAAQTNTFTFNSDSAKKVWIKISAQDTLANIRINEVKGPIDSIHGGPFGKETIFVLPSRGVYQFSISEKPTNPKPYAGKYKVELKLLWK